ncbi:MAG: hypothetical protein COW13_01410 [Candidatus Omnitrophica bacterium CG12_big_fil_rev_8_21_14_0_65_50_5]|nr:MAG: hypothetical protein COW13_01410 [Candidatus Omnitrophica bacterium CG12_big_fil_rev_8_21_14_0_65_50_5]
MLSLTQRFFKGLLVAVIGLLTTSGCIYLGVGAIGAVGGYMVSPDTVEGLVVADYADIWQACYDEIAKQGPILTQDETGGYLLSNVRGTEVTVQIVPTDSPQVWKISVKARKKMFPRVKLAQKIYTAIHNVLAP